MAKMNVLVASCCCGCPCKTRETQHNTKKNSDNRYRNKIAQHNCKSTQNNTNKRENRKRISVPSSLTEPTLIFILMTGATNIGPSCLIQSTKDNNKKRTQLPNTQNDYKQAQKQNSKKTRSRVHTGPAASIAVSSAASRCSIVVNGSSDFCFNAIPDTTQPRHKRPRMPHARIHANNKCVPLYQGQTDVAALAPDARTQRADASFASPRPERPLGAHSSSSLFLAIIALLQTSCTA